MNINQVELVKIKEFQRSQRLEITYRVTATNEISTATTVYPVKYPKPGLETDLINLAHQTQFPWQVWEVIPSPLPMTRYRRDGLTELLDHPDRKRPKAWDTDPSSEEEAIQRFHDMWAQSEAIAAVAEPPPTTSTWAVPPIAEDPYTPLNYDQLYELVKELNPEANTATIVTNLLNTINSAKQGSNQ